MDHGVKCLCIFLLACVYMNIEHVADSLIVNHLLSTYLMSGEPCLVLRCKDKKDTVLAFGVFKVE